MRDGYIESFLFYKNFQVVKRYSMVVIIELRVRGKNSELSKIGMIMIIKVMDY